MRAVPRQPAAREPVRSAEHEWEAAYGLPEPLPSGEHVIWQGQPQVRGVIKQIFHGVGLSVYFIALLLWAAVAQWDAQAPVGQWLRALVPLLIMTAVAGAIVAALAYLTASTTVYTITNRRVVMRIGIVLTVTFNLPLRCIDAAHVAHSGQGRGDIALALTGDTRIAYLHLWPHARPWHLNRPQPMLRCLDRVDDVCGLLMTAWSQANVRTAAADAAAASGYADRAEQASLPQAVA